MEVERNKGTEKMTGFFRQVYDTYSLDTQNFQVLDRAMHLGDILRS